MPNEETNSEPETITETNVLELRALTEISSDELGSLPAGYQKIYVKNLLPKAFDEAFMVNNKSLGFSALASGSEKPISKIIDLSHFADHTEER